MSGGRPNRGRLRVHQVGEQVRLDRVVVVHKTTTFEQQHARPDPRLADVLKSGDEAAQRIVGAHENHVETLATVLDVLLRVTRWGATAPSCGRRTASRRTNAATARR